MYLRSRLPVKKFRHLLHKRRKVRVFLWKGIWKNIISYYTSAFLINPQPRRRSVLSNKSVLLIYVLSLPVLLIHVLSLPSMFYQSSPVHVLSHACHHWFPRAMTSENERRNWWLVTTQIWVVLPTSWSKFSTRHDQSEALPRSGWWAWNFCVHFSDVILRGNGKVKLTYTSWRL